MNERSPEVVIPVYEIEFPSATNALQPGAVFLLGPCCRRKDGPPIAGGKCREEPLNNSFRNPARFSSEQDYEDLLIPEQLCFLDFLLFNIRVRKNGQPFRIIRESNERAN
jgi:hypothetical protein